MSRSKSNGHDVIAGGEAEAELAVGFFGARYDRATPAERDYMVAMADLRGKQGTTGPSAPPRWPGCWGREWQSLSPPATA